MYKGIQFNGSEKCNGHLESEANEDEKITSTLVEDPYISEILPAYLNELSSRISTLSRAISVENWRDVEKLSHQLQGSLVGYGFPQLHVLAEKIYEVAQSTKRKDDAANYCAKLMKLGNSALSSQA